MAAGRMGVVDMVLVGITGGIGAGKSTLARLLAERGATVVDADRVGHEIVERPAVRAQLRAAFGSGILDSDGHLNRRELGRRAFADADSLRRLNAIVRPHLEPELWRQVETAAAAGAEIVVVDAPLILEWQIQERFDALVAVVAGPEQRRRRVQARGLEAGEFDRRAPTQASTAAQVAAAHHVVENDGDLTSLATAADRLISALRRPVP
ncbi:MAG: dephospho-CoA kinase [Gemmatimonadota bacterium]